MRDVTVTVRISDETQHPGFVRVRADIQVGERISSHIRVSAREELRDLPGLVAEHVLRGFREYLDQRLPL